MQGVWLEKLYGGRNWWTMTSSKQDCIVRLETVVDANIDMHARSDQNPLQSVLMRRSVKKANVHGAWQVLWGYM